MSNVHPEILDGLDYETQYIQRTSGAQRRIVKLNRGDSWLLRFIPAQIGPNKRWYARVAKHFVQGQRAIVCPRETEEAFGGHPEAYCPVCDLSAHLNDDRNEEVGKFGFKLRASANWITYCAVFEKAAQGGAAQPQPLPEVLQPYEFPHYRTSWEELCGFVRQGARRTPNSVLDFEKGNDFYVSKTAKGLRLDKQDTGPIFDLADPKFDENCQKLIAGCKDPVVKIPDEKTMENFADKAQEEADNIARGKGGTAGGRGAARTARDEDDLPPQDDRAARGGRRYAESDQEAPPARARTAPPAAPAAAPVRRAAAPPAQAAAPVRRAAAPPPPEPEQEQEQPPEDQGDPGAEGEGEQPPADEGGEAPPEEQQPEPPPARTQATRPSASRSAAPAPARAPAPAPARPAAPVTAPARTAPPARAAAPAPARTAPARGTGAPVAQESIDENEHIPEEANDQAPPQPLVDPADDPGAAETPPPVENTRRGQFASSIRGKIAAVNATTKK